MPHPAVSIFSADHVDRALTCRPCRRLRFASTHHAEDLEALDLDEAGSRGSESRGPSSSRDRCSRWTKSGFRRPTAPAADLGPHAQSDPADGASATGTCGEVSGDRVPGLRMQTIVEVLAQHARIRTAVAALHRLTTPVFPPPCDRSDVFNILRISARATQRSNVSSSSHAAASGSNFPSDRFSTNWPASLRSDPGPVRSSIARIERVRGRRLDSSRESRCVACFFVDEPASSTSGSRPGTASGAPGIAGVDNRSGRDRTTICSEPRNRFEDRSRTSGVP